MSSGAITGYIDVAQLVLYAFWIFFAGLILYLRREDKREGYPLESDRTARAGRVRVQGFPAIPRPKVFTLASGETVMAPSGKVDTREVRARPVAPWPGAPLTPTGDPLAEGVGPAAYAQRADKPDLTFEGTTRILPLRLAQDHSLEARDPDPRGMTVIAADGKAAGTVRDLWVDRSEAVIRDLEDEVAASTGPRHVLLPVNFTRINARRGQVKVVAIMADQFAGVPPLAQPDQVTLLEEDRIMAYYGGGHLYAEPSRLGPWL